MENINKLTPNGYRLPVVDTDISRLIGPARAPWGIHGHLWNVALKIVDRSSSPIGSQPPKPAAHTNHCIQHSSTIPLSSSRQPIYPGNISARSYLFMDNPDIPPLNLKSWPKLRWRRTFGLNGRWGTALRNLSGSKLISAILGWRFYWPGEKKKRNEKNMRVCGFFRTRRGVLRATFWSYI